MQFPCESCCREPASRLAWSWTDQSLVDATDIIDWACGTVKPLCEACFRRREEARERSSLILLKSLEEPTDEELREIERLRQKFPEEHRP